jgi:hypothetical protein
MFIYFIHLILFIKCEVSILILQQLACFVIKYNNGRGPRFCRRLLWFQSVFRIRGILKFLGLLDPDPLVRGTNPDPSIIKQTLKNYANVPSKSNKQKTCWGPECRRREEQDRSRIRIWIR